MKIYFRNGMHQNCTLGKSADNTCISSFYSGKIRRKYVYFLSVHWENMRIIPGFSHCIESWCIGTITDSTQNWIVPVHFLVLEWQLRGWKTLFVADPRRCTWQTEMALVVPSSTWRTKRPDWLVLLAAPSSNRGHGAQTRSFLFVPTAGVLKIIRV